MGGYPNDPIQMGMMLLMTAANECDPRNYQEAELARFLHNTIGRIRGCRSNTDVFRELLVGCNAIISSLDCSAEWKAYMVETANAFFDGINRAFVDNGEPGYRKARFGDPLSTTVEVNRQSRQSPVSQAKDESTPYAQLVTLSHDDDWEVRAGVASNSATPESLLRELATDSNEGVRSYVARNENAPRDVLEVLSSDASEYVRDFLAQNPALPLPLMLKLAVDPHWRPRSGLAENPNIPTELVERLKMDSDPRVRGLAMQNPSGSSIPF